MPMVIDVVYNKSGFNQDPHAYGCTMPPALVMEKGETLTERIHRCKNSISTMIHVLSLHWHAAHFCMITTTITSPTQRAERASLVDDV